MINLLSFLLECMGLFVASKILNVNLTVITVPIVILLSTLAFKFIPGFLGYLVAMLIYFSVIKYFDKECDFIKLVGLVIIGIAVQKGLIDFILEPFFLSKTL